MPGPFISRPRLGTRILVQVSILAYLCVGGHVCNLFVRVCVLWVCV